MRKLLRSDLRRLLHSKLFYGGILAVAVVMVFALANNVYYSDVMVEIKLPLDNLLFMGTTVLCFLISVFTTFFIGVEFADGTMRNKLIVGHSRPAMYLSYLITTSLASLGMLVVGSLPVLLVGSIWQGWFVTSPAILLPQIACCLCSVVALNAVIVALAMILQKRAITAVVCLLLVFILVNVVSPFLWDILNAEPMLPEMVFTEEDGSLFVIPEEPNPYYLTGSRRALVQWLYDTLPTAQMYQYTYEELPKNIALFPLYSLLLIGALSAAGIAVYRRRDLK